MRTTIPLIVALLLLALLTWWCACHVEQHVQATASETLIASGHDWARAEADGRWVTVSGTASTPARQAQALELVLATEAVTRVNDATTLREVVDADVDPVRSALSAERLGWVDLGREDRTLSMTGIAPEVAERARAENVATPLWPWGPVDNRITVADSEAGQSVLACREALGTLLASDQVHFESDSARLRPEGELLLARLVLVLEGCPQTQIRIEAHSDNTGDADYNLQLSQDRAESVLTYLERAGIGANRLSAFGYGEARPIADNDTEEGKAANRRVEFRISL